MNEDEHDDAGGRNRTETGRRNRLAGPGSPGGAAAFSAVSWGIIAYLTTESILLGALVFVAVLTSLEAIAGFTLDRSG